MTAGKVRRDQAKGGLLDDPVMSVDVDMALGGRWTSLRGCNGREWLWRRAAPDRASVQPGDAFVDAGGLEECLPTIGGPPDHGDVWCRPWSASPDGGLFVQGDGYWLSRRVEAGSAVTAFYRLEATPGWWFIWAAHALVDLAPGAVLDVPSGRDIWVNSTDGTTSSHWPRYGDTNLGLLGEDDGQALMVIIPELDTLTVHDGADSLTMRLSVQAQPSGFAIWRNLGGWPESEPYRNVGIEPMLGYSPTLALAGPGESAVMPASGVVEWSLTIKA